MKNLLIKMRGVLLLLVFVIFIIQGETNILKIKPLGGYILIPEKVHFSLEKWFAGEYQLQEEKYLNETFGLRSIFIRVNNQIAYSFFNKVKANGVIIGINNYLYEENYIKAYFGTDFIGVDSITKRMQHLKFIQDTLGKLNKTIIVVFAAGKGSFFPEYFPKEYIKEKGRTNYEFHLKLAKELGINYIDFNHYFVENKFKSKYPLYPQYGIHWSIYGASLAADSMIKYIEMIRGIEMPHLYWNDIVLDNAKESDYDLGNGINLLFDLKGSKMAYPVIEVQSDSGKIKPSAIVVADSYYWCMFYSFSRAFSKNQFWYYNKEIYSSSSPNTIEISQVNLKDEIRNNDIIIIMATEATLPRLGWGFIENCYNLFKGFDSKIK